MASPLHASGMPRRGFAPRSATGRGLVMTGAGNGIAAKFIERGGVDLIGVYNTGYFRMQGYGSLAGMLPIADANELVFRTAEREVLPQVEVDAGDRRRQRRRSAARHAALPRGAAPDRHFRRPQFPDRRLVRRRVPAHARGDRPRLRARARDAEHRPRARHADDRLRLQRGGHAAADAGGGARHLHLPRRHHRRRHDRRCRRRRRSRTPPRAASAISPSPGRSSRT